MVSVWVPRVVVWLWIPWDSVGVDMKLNHIIWHVEAVEILLVLIQKPKGMMCEYIWDITGVSMKTYET